MRALPLPPRSEPDFGELFQPPQNYLGGMLLCFVIYMTCVNFMAQGFNFPLQGPEIFTPTVLTHLTHAQVAQLGALSIGLRSCIL